MDLFKDMKPRNIGPAGMSGRVTSIEVVQSQPDLIYIGAASGGVWRSENAGITWTPIMDNEKAHSIGAIAVNQSNPDEIWVGTGEGNPRNSQSSGYGIYKSIDRGKTWQHMGLEKTRNIHRVIMHPNDPKTIYVGAQGSAWNESTDKGVYRTTNGGESWERVLYVDKKTGIADLVIDPSNPNKLMAAMWEFRRWPYFFKSGGPGSGLYVTYDGGDNWKKRTDKDGLPKGELGRMGLSISASNPRICYAFIEAKKNAIYRSNDGGEKWFKVSKAGNFGNRPFYYADLYTDPSNSEVVYSIHSIVTVSRDGGKNWSPFTAWSTGVHPDHQSFYINPNNPLHVITGNDGGLAQTKDGGKYWTFMQNLPLSQFYHINVDKDLPYHVYGGMQDNGSWKGPGYTWKNGGILNNEWLGLMGGDGFDVVPDPDNSRYGYAMWQGGNLGRWDSKTGQNLTIKPIHPEGKPLRFNWNAAIAQDPFNSGTIYYGSQYVHKSTDRGRSWTIISPDLTTNDTTKQDQENSGGLTLDVTNAENYTTIVSIAPSTVTKDVIWVGTDDGNVQLTKDGGKTWTNFTPKMKGLPKNCWVPQIEPSRHNDQEAFVVINNYRQGDWTPYLYHTADGGKTWKNLVSTEKVWGYCLSVVQDFKEPNLLFLGTEFHLYVSFDKGATWNKWKHGYPTASTMDLKIQEAESDLVIGTFGRAAWVIDDISPLRAVAKDRSVLNKDLLAFEAPTAYNVETNFSNGFYFPTNDMFRGDDRSTNARIRYYVKQGAKGKKKAAKDSGSKDKKAEKPETGAHPDSVYLRIYNGDNLIRTIRQYPDSGINTISWGMDEKGPYWPSWEEPDRSGQERNGNYVKPGKFRLEFKYGEASSESSIEVKLDPRIEYTQAQIDEIYTFQRSVESLIGNTAKIMDELRATNKELAKVEKLMPKEDSDSSFAQLKKDLKTNKDSVNQLMEMVMGKRETKGIVRWGHKVWHKVSSANGSAYSAYDPPNQNQKRLMKEAKEAYNMAVNRVNAYKKDIYSPFKKSVDKANLELFSDREALKKVE